MPSFLKTGCRAAVSKITRLHKVFNTLFLFFLLVSTTVQTVFTQTSSVVSAAVQDTIASDSVKLVIIVPRLVHPPLDGILAVDFVLSNYFGSQWANLCDEPEYQKIIRAVQEEAFGDIAFVWFPLAAFAQLTDIVKKAIVNRYFVYFIIFNLFLLSLLDFLK